MKIQVSRDTSRLVKFAALICFAVVGLTGCKTYTTDAFINDLRATGASVRSEPLSVNIFGVPGSTVFINGNAVTVLEFPDDQQASDAVRGFWPTGSTLNPQGGWTETHSSLPTRYYRKGALMVIYVGDNSYVTGVLRSLLGAHVGGNTLGFFHTPCWKNMLQNSTICDTHSLPHALTLTRLRAHENAILIGSALGLHSPGRCAITEWCNQPQRVKAGGLNLRLRAA